MNVNRKVVRECLRAISDEVMEKIDNINSGGCGIYAIELAKRLQMFGVTDFNIRCYGWYRNINVSDVENLLSIHGEVGNFSEWQSNGVDFHHIRLEWDGRTWDADGDELALFAEHWGMSVRQNGAVTVESLSKLTSNYRIWNRRFDRSQIPKLRRIMDKHFRKLTQSNTLPMAA